MVIRTTPLAPREPYIAVADASFKISIDSFGFKDDKGLNTAELNPFGSPTPVPASLDIGAPSMTYNGSLSELIEPVPRI